MTEDWRPANPLEEFGQFGRALFHSSRALAIFGGLTFRALVVMWLVSIVGRKLWSAPVPGDVEALQMGSAFAAASFFAYCHLMRGDVKVDFSTERWPARVVATLDAIGSLLVGLFGSLIAWYAAAEAHCHSPPPAGDEWDHAGLVPHHPTLLIAAAPSPWKCISPRK